LRVKKAGLIVALFVVAAAVVGVLYARGGGGGVAPVNADSRGLALRGYDAVAYFSEGRAAEGRADFIHDWNGARWLFQSAAARDEFARAPEAYAPQYGGYCAWAVGHGYTADGDPEAWKIVGGKLYLNYNEQVRAMWEQDVPRHVAAGDRNWPTFLAGRPEHKGGRR
jgi:hypothetical protein